MTKHIIILIGFFAITGTLLAQGVGFPDEPAQGTDWWIRALNRSWRCYGMEETEKSKIINPYHL
ncbi:MAG: hypothetical protein HOM78_07605 [Candidatus Marinimicrobia bacterium]|jgi:hypothetical protein|nr:hypothetical protein [Candidatus Neomarinimicrobiota bacterium]MBT4957639.1 hypothetical protein [Candidatus Neomarinimicrobiota bacterium]MBT5462121.1 hypothetical protein [Candidatus Neomarinimicrobiota bacterium]MBT5760538.1 hypothetical protein [Candidatus Neomarinimicrobiota bacterium]